MSARLSILSVALPWLLATGAGAQDSAGTNNVADTERSPAAASPTAETNRAALTARIDELLKTMVSTDFSMRQKATAELLSLEAAGVGILDQKSRLLTGPEAPRVREIVGRLRKRLFDDRLTAFNQKPSIETAAGLPEWARFSALVGQDEKALEVYRQMLNAEKDLFSMRMFGSPELSSTLDARSSDFSTRCNGRRNEPFPTASCAALMLLGSDSTLDLPRLTSPNISDAFDDERFDDLINEGVYSDCLRRLVGAWMHRSNSNGRPAIAVDRPLLFSMEHSIPEGRTLALRVIESGGKFQTMYHSLFCIAHFRNADDLKVVESLLEAPTVLWPVGNRNAKQFSDDFESTYTVQTRDVALAVAAHLRNRNPTDFGSSARPSPLTVFDVYSLGFDTDEDRAAAIAEYRRAFP